MRFSVLASGSSGNATVVEADGSAVLVDCGLSVRRLRQRAAEVGFDPAALSAIVVTHEHGDHIGGVAALSRRYGIPVYMTPGTRMAAAFESADVVEISAHEPFAIGGLLVRPAPVPHDAREPCQFVFDDGSTRLGILTDLGSHTPHVEQHFAACGALVLEFNHDLDLLSACEYPPSVKARIASRLGHFNNGQAASLLGSLRNEGLHHVVGAHVSQRANRPDLVDAILGTALGGSDCDWCVAEQDRPTDWIVV